MQTPSYLKSFLVLLSLAGLICVLTLLVNGCRHRKPVPDTITVNPAFELLPPLARSVSIQRLENNDDGNLLLTADFGKGVLKDPFHAIMLGEEKMLLRDDGTEGDAVAGDGSFSIVLKEDTVALLQALDRSSRLLRDGKTITVFRHRTLQLLPASQEKISEIERFKKGGLLHIDPSVFALVANPVLKDRSLSITAPTVVEDPGRTFNPCTGVGNPAGAWAFARLVTEMANTPLTGVQPKDFLLQWLQSWSANQLVNGDLIAQRPNISTITHAWQTLSSGTFDIKFAPFKLIAIVNRIDLRGNSGYGFGNPGEGRFVFCAVDASCHVIRNPAPFMIILEYGIPKHKCADLKAYAQQWYNLRLLTPGTAAYNSALELITNQFTLANTSPSKPNGSSINQVRTNEFALGAGPWELREFNIDSVSHLLRNVTVKQEPQDTFNFISPHAALPLVQVMAGFVNTHTADIEANRYAIPLQTAGKNFAAGKAHTENAGVYHWDGTAVAGPGFINSDSARFMLSLNTCSGCHGGEAKTGNFMHVAPGGISGVPAVLSAFLTGAPPLSGTPFFVTDPAGRPVGSPHIRGFNDLERRALDLDAFANAPCIPPVKSLALARLLTFDPVRMTH
jgi:hypothetical protein